MTSNGVVLKVDTSDATRSQGELTAATKASFTALEQQNKVLTQVEAHLRGMAQAQDFAAQASARAAAAARAAAEAQQRALGTFGGASNPNLRGGLGQPGGDLKVANDFLLVQQKQVDAQKKVAEESKKAATGVVAAGNSANTAAPFFQRLLAASGQTGAARGLGLVATGARAVLTSMNPVGIATGLAATAILTLAINAASAQTPLQKLQAQAKEAQERFDLLAESSAKVSEALSGAAGARGATFGARSTDDAVKALEALEAKIVDVQRKTDRASFFGGDGFKLNIDQVKELAEAINLPLEVLRDLDRASKAAGDEQDRLIRKLRESGLAIEGVRNPNLFSQRTIVLDAAEAQKKLADELNRTGAKLNERRDILRESIQPYADLNAELSKELANIGLGNKEREVQAKLDKLSLERNGKLTEQQKEAEVNALSLARSLDEQAKAAQNLARAQAEVEQQLAEDVADAYEYTQALAEMREETELLTASEEEREKILLQRRIRDAQRNLRVDPDSPEGREVADAVAEGDAVRKKVEQTTRAMQVFRDIAYQSGQVLADGLADAVLQAQSFEDAIENVTRAIGELIVRQLISRAIEMGIDSAFGTPGTNGGNQLGGVLPNRGHPTVFAQRGMVLDRFTTLARGGLNIGVAEGGASTPEAVLPLGRDQYGRLGIRSADGGGSSLTVVLPNVRSGDDARRIRPTIQQTLESIDRSRRRDMRAGQ